MSNLGIPGRFSSLVNPNLASVFRYSMYLMFKSPVTGQLSGNTRQFASSRSGGADRGANGNNAQRARWGHRAKKAEAKVRVWSDESSTDTSSDADGEASETIVWINFAKDCEYINEGTQNKLIKKYEEVGRMLGSMADNPIKFLPK